MKKMMKRLKNEKGLTLVELLAVVVILAIVAAIAFVMIGNVMENAKKDAAVADALQVINAAKLYETTNALDDTDEGITIAGEKVTIAMSILQKEGDEYLEKLHDPWTKEVYGSETTVEIENGEYKVNIKSEGCDIKHPEDELLEEGREVCD